MNTEDKFYFGNAGTKAESELTIRITKMLRDVEQAILSRNKDKAKALAVKVRDMIRKSANASYSKAQMEDLESIMLGISFSRVGKAERFGMAEQVLRDGSVHLDFVAARDYLAKQTVDGLRYIIKDAGAARDANGTEGRKFNYYTDLVLEAHRELKKRGFSRPGQPEKFDRDIPIKSWTRGSTKYEAGITEDAGRFQPYVNMPESGILVTRSAPTFKTETGARKWLEAYMQKMNASRPGQPERFDASSLDRKGFAGASSSPMLGKLLSEKQMPEGGWRAVETGGGALVISFEDGDVAGNFARRVASHGYSATAPVQSIGRYWNVEVKNGK